MAGVEVKAHPEWRLAVEKYSAQPHGTRISHAELSRVLGLPYGSLRYYQMAAKFSRVMLADHNLAVRTSRKEGYVITEPDKYREQSRTEMLRGRRRIRRSVDILSVAPMDLMSTDAERTMAANSLAHFAPLLAASNAAVRKTTPSSLKRLMTTQDLPKLKG